MIWSIIGEVIVNDRFWLYLLAQQVAYLTLQPMIITLQMGLRA